MGIGEGLKLLGDSNRALSINSPPSITKPNTGTWADPMHYYFNVTSAFSAVRWRCDSAWDWL